MPNDNDTLDNQQNDQNLEQDQGNQQQQQQDSDIGQGRVPDSLDASLDNFLKEADGQPRAPAGNKKQEGQDDQTKQQVQQPNKQQQQPNAQPNGQGTQQNQPTQQVPQTGRKFGDLFQADAHGNIYDARGTLVAKAGYGHQIFRKIYPHLERTQTELAAANNKVQNYERATQAAKDAGLSIDEQSAALSLMVAYKKDAKAAINFMLQQAQARGIDTSDIVQGGGGVNETTLRSVLEDIVEKKLERFTPFVTQQQQAAEQLEQQQEAVQIYSEFMEQHPDADIHKGAIASVMEATGLPLNEAYYTLQVDALKKGLDWNKPLAPQYQALKDKSGNNRAPNGDGQNQRQLPNFGRSNNGVTNHTPSVANADDSWDSIITQAVDSVRGQAAN